MYTKHMRVLRESIQSTKRKKCPVKSRPAYIYIAFKYVCKKYLDYDVTVYNVPMQCTEMLTLQRCIQCIVCIHTYVCGQYNTQRTYVILFRKLLYMTLILFTTLCDKQMIQFNLEKSLQYTLFTSSSNFTTTLITPRSLDHCGTYGQL